MPLGQWAIGKAAAVLADWDKQNGGKIVDCYFSVNVSAIQLLRDDVAAVVRQALDTHKIGGERLMIELTESAIIGDRNAKCLEVMDTELGKGRKKLAIFYGAAHFPDMEKRLLEKGFKMTKQEWATAWDVPKPEEVKAEPAEPLKKAS